MLFKLKSRKDDEKQYGNSQGNNCLVFSPFKNAAYFRNLKLSGDFRWNCFILFEQP